MSSTTAPKTILLMGDPVAKEAVANAAITPGHLIERMSTGKVRKHSTAGGPAMAMFAREEEYVGGGIDTAYASSDQVPFYVCRRGDEVYALLPASAPAVAIGDYLESNGDGTLRKVVDPLSAANGTADGVIADVTNSFVQATLNNNFKDVAVAVNGLKASAIAVALEAVDNSGNAGGPVRIRVEIL